MSLAFIGSTNRRARGSSGKRDWGLLFGGVALFAAGLIIAIWPGLTLVALATFAGIMLLLSGVFDLVTYVRFRKTMDRSVWVLVNALCSIALGAVFVLHPAITAAVIPWLIGAFVMAYGVAAIVGATRLRRMGPGWGLMLANGIVSVLCGLSFILMPATFVVFLGIFLMMRGVTMAVFGVMAPRSVPYV